jgi:uncharacterized protein (TIGR02147 family)
MLSTVFDFKNYQSYLLFYFGDKKNRKGLKSKAAEFLGSHPTLLSQVLHGKVDLNLEQAEKLNRFIGHSDEESHYFLLMVQKSRAGTKTLESYFQIQMNQVLKARRIIKKRVGHVDSVSLENETKYYSSWQFSAVHVALSLPRLNQIESIAGSLGIPIRQVKTIISFLIQAGLVQEQDGKHILSRKHIHLGAESSNIKNHHTNWRIKAIQSLENQNRENFHYSSAVSLSRASVDAIKELLIQSLKDVNKVIQDSQEEVLYGFNFDFYNLET